MFNQNHSSLTPTTEHNKPNNLIINGPRKFPNSTHSIQDEKVNYFDPLQALYCGEDGNPKHAGHKSNTALLQFRPSTKKCLESQSEQIIHPRPVTVDLPIHKPNVYRSVANVPSRFVPLFGKSDWSQQRGEEKQNEKNEPHYQKRTLAATSMSPSSTSSLNHKIRSPNFNTIQPYINKFHADGDLNPATILRTCDQFAPIPIDIVFKNLRRIKKVGEGVYGEVYLAHNLNVSPSVYKIVAVEGAKLVNGEKQKKFAEIEPEILVSRRLNQLLIKNNQNYTTGFVQLYTSRICQGSYPSTCVDAWKLWHRDNFSENDLPQFDDSQLYVIFEYKFSGSDVESYRFRSAKQAFAMLIQVTFSLAAAESALKFEHRDLHWGNILVSPVNESQIKFIIKGIEYCVPSEGLQSTIIDFTISRVDGEDGSAVFTDLKDDTAQFTGPDDYQFEIYRKMRNINGNDWSTFHPSTNVFWLHYLVQKLMTKARYTDKSSSTHLYYLKRMDMFKEIILRFESCANFAADYPDCESRPV